MELPDFPGRNPDLNPDEGEEHSVSITVTRDQIESLRESFGIDVEALVRSALVNEVYMQIGKQISKACFNEESTEIDFSLLESLISNLKGFGFILTNLQLATIFQDYEGLNIIPLKEFGRNTGAIYELGKLGEYRIFVDPMLRWDDDRLAIINNNFYNFKQLESISLVAEGSMAPRTVTKMIMNTKKAEGKVFKINNIQI